MKGFSAEFRCLRGCEGGRASLDEVIYRCPVCGDLLEVVHDLDALRGRSPAAWKRLFDERLGTGPWPYGSGVWGKVEWVHPLLSEADIVSLGEGRTPLVPVEALAHARGVREVWVKHSGTSHTGSFKDLGMTVLVSAVQAMRRAGKPIRAVGCASTGDTSASLAAYCAAAGIPSVVFLPRGKISTSQLMQPMSHGALVLALDTDFDGCMKIVQEVAASGDVYLANSMNSLRIEGQKTVAIELCQQLGWSLPDWVVLPGGNLGNVSAVVAGFELLVALGVTDHLPRVCVGQASRANPLFRASQADWSLEPQIAGDTAASAIRIGNPVSFGKAVRALKACGGIVRQASEAELAEAASEADRMGLFADPHTGVALAALRQLADEGLVGPSDRVVVISTAHALKFPEFKVAYHEERLSSVTSQRPNRPVEVAASVDEVKKVLDARL